MRTGRWVAASLAVALSILDDPADADEDQPEAFAETDGGAASD